MRKPTLALIATLCLLNLSTGCNNDDADDGTDTETDTDSESDTEPEDDTDDDIDTEFVPSPSCPVFVTVDGSDELDGSTWDDAKATVTDGISAAKQLVDEENENTTCEVWVAKGTYKPTTDTNRERSFRLKDGVHLFGGFFGNETDIEQRDFENNLTSLSGNIDGQNSLHVVRCTEEDSCGNGAIIDGFTVCDGYASESEAHTGAGMYNIKTSPTIRNCTFEDNEAYNVYWADWDDYGDEGYYEGEGGGMYNESADPLIINCVFRSNHALNGGGISSSGGSLTISNCVFENNSTGYDDWSGLGGAIFNKNNSSTIKDCLFRNNSAGGNGVAIFSRDSAVALTNCSFIEHDGLESGSAVGHDGPSPLNITNSLFDVNTISGIGLHDSPNTSVANSTLIGDFSQGDYTENSTGIRCDKSAPIISNCIFDNFEGENGTSIETDSSSEPTISYSNVEGGCENIEGAICGDGNIDEDPLFVDFENGDFHLQAGSPCIDTGFNDALPLDEFDLDDDGDTDELIPYDLDGNDRVVNKIVDMGAFEFPS